MAVDLARSCTFYMPKSKGGNNTNANWDSLCGEFCNPSKNADSPYDWLERLIRGQGPPKPR